jgi:hypothetical protein
MIDKVAARHFYQDDGDKVLIHWFLYEYANILYAEIESTAKLASYRKKQGEAGVVAFCVYFSKRMRRSISHARDNRTNGIHIDASYIYEFYPGNPRNQTQRLLDAAARAWREHIEACMACSNRCVNEEYERTAMFDNLEKTGWPTL